MIKYKINKREIFKNVILITVGFLLSRIILPGGVIPFGYSFFTATLGGSVSSILTGAAVGLGALSTGFDARSLIVIISLLTLSAYKILIGKQTIEGKQKKYSALIPIILSGLVASAVVLLINGFTIKDMLMAVIQNIISVAGYFIFQGAVRSLSLKNEKFILTEDISSVVITLILAVFGLPAIIVFEISLRNVFGIFLIIMFTYKRSIGLLAKLGKTGTAVASAVVIPAIAIMTGMSDNMIALIKDFIIADLIFFLIPDKLLNKLKIPGASNINTVIEKANYADEISVMAAGRLEGFSKGYSLLARSFTAFVKKEENLKDNADFYIGRTYSKVCEKCDMTEFCWKRTKKEMGKAFFEMAEMLERNGKIIWEHVPEFFKEECEKPQDILAELRVAFELARVEKIWNQKLKESREVFSMQLNSLAGAAKNLAHEMREDIQITVKVSEELERDLNKSGYHNAKTRVFQNRFGKYEVDLEYGGRVDSALIRIISGVIGRRMVDAGKMHFIEANKLKVLSGASAIAKIPGDVSGDSFTFINGGGGLFTAVLCDGMGTGKRAREESMMAVKMIENFIYNGFDSTSAIEMINSAMVMKSNEDNYSTLDLVNINLQNGNAEILKFGGMPTVIKYKVEEEEYALNRQYLPAIESITSSSLPVGIVNNVSGRSVCKKVCAGDCIIMMSDGVYDAFRQGGRTGGDLIRFVEMTECSGPQRMADLILQEALKINSAAYKMVSGEVSEGETVEPPDDMTVLVMIIEKDYL